LNSFTSSLPHFHGLKNLCIGRVKGITAEIADKFLKAVERNTTLEHISLAHEILPKFKNPHAEKIKSRLDHIMSLNRAGRRVLSSSNVPRSLWPRILGKSSDNRDALFFFLREKPDVFFMRHESGRKRKRDESDR